MLFLVGTLFGMKISMRKEKPTSFNIGRCRLTSNIGWYNLWSQNSIPNGTHFDRKSYKHTFCCFTIAFDFQYNHCLYLSLSLFLSHRMVHGVQIQLKNFHFYGVAGRVRSDVWVLLCLSDYAKLLSWESSSLHNLSAIVLHCNLFHFLKKLIALKLFKSV